jgi:hypothetical protein
MADAAASVRLRTPSLPKMVVRWYLTVFVVMKSTRAMSALLLP